MSLRAQWLEQLRMSLRLPPQLRAVSLLHREKEAASALTTRPRGQPGHGLTAQERTDNGRGSHAFAWRPLSRSTRKKNRPDLLGGLAASNVPLF
jgi:hypothetical protein